MVLSVQERPAGELDYEDGHIRGPWAGNELGAAMSPEAGGRGEASEGRTAEGTDEEGQGHFAAAELGEQLRETRLTLEDLVTQFFFFGFAYYTHGLFIRHSTVRSFYGASKNCHGL